MTGASAARRTTRIRAAIVAGTLAIGALGIASCGSGAARTGATPVGAADYIPAGSLVYLEASTAFDSAQWQTALDLAGRFPGFDELIATAKKDLADQKLNFERDIRPLLGDSAAVGIVSIDPARLAAASANRTIASGTSDGATVVAAIDIADGKEAEFERYLTTSSHSRVERVDTVNGSTIYRSTDSSGDVSWGAVVDGAFVVGNTEDVLRSAIAAHASGTTMAGSQRLRGVLAMLPSDTLAQGYMDLVGLTDLMKRSANSDALKQLEKVTIGPNAAIGMSVTAEGDGLRLRAIGNDYRAAGAAASFSPTLTASVPADAIAYLGATNLFETGRAAIQNVVAGDAQARDRLTQMKGALALVGLSPADLETLLSGEAALTVGAGDAPGAPTVGAILTTGDGTASAAALDRVRDALPKLASGKVPPFTAVPLAGGVRGWKSAASPTADIVYGVDGDRVIAGTSAAAVRRLQGPKLPLADDPAFDAATSQMPAKVSGLMWVNGDRLWPVMKAAGAFDEAPAAALPNLRHVRNVAAWATEGDTQTFEAFVTIK